MPPSLMTDGVRSRAETQAILRAYVAAHEAGELIAREARDARDANGGKTVPSDIPPSGTHKPEPPGPTPTPEPEPKPIWDPEPGLPPQPEDTPPPIIDPAIPTSPKPIITLQRCRLLQ